MGIAAIAIAIDHTKHKVPTPQTAEQSIHIVESDNDDSPCGMGEDESPCGMDADESPCGMGEDESPCGM